MTNLYISAIRIPAQSPAVATARTDFYMLHRLVYAAFPTKEAATAARVLFRFDLEGDAGYLYVQSQAKPDWSRVPEGIAKNFSITGPIPLHVPEGDRLRFRLLAKPSCRNGKKDDKDKGSRTTIREEKAQLAWLRRKGQDGGFEVEECVFTERVWFDSKRKETLPNGNPKPLYGIQFDGILKVTDPDKLRLAVRNGIGPQKAFGFGLLSLAPLRD